MGGISTHVLDTAGGAPAAGLAVSLERRDGSGGGQDWIEIYRGKTDSDGRIGRLWPEREPLESGVFRLSFDTGSYFGGLGVDTFYPEVRVSFEVRDASQHHHVPILLSPFGYSTYRGS